MLKVMKKIMQFITQTNNQCNHKSMKHYSQI